MYENDYALSSAWLRIERWGIAAKVDNRLRNSPGAKIASKQRKRKKN
jgi:hypothetical protein